MEGRGRLARYSVTPLEAHRVLAEHRSAALARGRNDHSYIQQSFGGAGEVVLKCCGRGQLMLRIVNQHHNVIDFRVGTVVGEVRQ